SRRLRSAMRAFGERRLDLLDRLGFGEPLNGSDLTRQPVERRLVELPLRVGLLRLRLRPIKIPHDFGDGHDVAGIDLGLVFLRPPRPHGALDACAALERLERALDHRGFGELAHADRRDFRGRDAQRHLVLDEIDHEQLEPGTCHLLLFDRHDLAHAVGRIHDEFVRLEALPLRSLLCIHSQTCSFRLRRLAPRDGLCHADPGSGRPRGLSWPPACARGGFACLPAYAGRALLRTMTTSFLCHSSRVGLTPLLTIPRKTPRRTSSLTERAAYRGCVSLWNAFITHFRPKSKRYGNAKASHSPKRLRPSSREKNPEPQSPVPGLGEKYFSYLPATPSN